MPPESTQYRGRIIPFAAQAQLGQCGDVESGLQTYPWQGAGFRLLTGGSNGLLADVTYNMASALTLVPAVNCIPSSQRFRLTALGLAVHGNVAWAGGTAVIVQDTSGYPQAYFPLISLGALAQYRFPSSGVNQTLTPTVASYNSTTGVMTFPSSTFITTTLANVPFRVVAGTGRGQTGIIASNTATTLTPTTILGTALDSTSVVEVCYYIATAGGNTTITASNAAWTANVLVDGGYWVVIIAGTGAGQKRLITANSTTALTVATWTTNPDTTSVFQVTQSPNLNGALDLAVGQGFSASTLSKGLQVALLGSFSGATSSPLRLYAEGFLSV